MRKTTIILLAAIIIFSLALTLCPQDANAIDLTSKTAQVGSAAGFGNESETNLAKQIGQMIQALLSLLGVVFMIYVIYGGYLWMAAAGNDEQIGKAKAIIKGSIIGLIIVLSAYAITAFVVTRVGTATNYNDAGAGTSR